MEGARRQGLVLVPLLLLLASLACANDSAARPVDDHFLPGDLLFRRGSGIASEIARNFSSGERRFSHVGVLVERDGQLIVVHSIFDEETNRDGVVSDPVSVFLDAASDWALYRVRIPLRRRELIAEAALSYLDRAVPFDSKFSLESEDRLYCTELVWRVVNDVADRNLIRASTAANDARVVSISDVYKGSEISLVVEAPSRSVMKDN